MSHSTAHPHFRAQCDVYVNYQVQWIITSSIKLLINILFLTFPTHWYFSLVCLNNLLSPLIFTCRNPDSAQRSCQADKDVCEVFITEELHQTEQPKLHYLCCGNSVWAAQFNARNCSVDLENRQLSRQTLLMPADSPGKEAGGLHKEYVLLWSNIKQTYVQKSLEIVLISPNLKINFTSVYIRGTCKRANLYY